VSYPTPLPLFLLLGGLLLAPALFATTTEPFAERSPPLAARAGVPPEKPSGHAQLTAFLQDLRTLQADFQQLIYAPGYGPTANSASGTFYLQRPRRFRWDYQAPNPQQIIADGISVWHYDPELEQVRVQFQAIALRGTPTRLLMSEEPLEELFTLEEQGERDGLAWILLTPKEEEPKFREIELGFADNLLQAIRMIDPFDQTIWFLFDQLEKNPPLDRQLFRFQPPPGYDVFEF